MRCELTEAVSQAFRGGAGELMTGESIQQEPNHRQVDEALVMLTECFIISVQLSYILWLIKAKVYRASRRCGLAASLNLDVSELPQLIG